MATIPGTGGADTLTGDIDSNFNDSISGGAGNDLLYGLTGNDTLRGGGDDDTLFGAAGNDSLRGDAGNDILIGGTGNDVIDGDGGTDTASYEGSSAGVNVTINASGNTGGDAAGDSLVEIENLRGSSNNDTLTGDAAGNVVEGGAGNDTVYGGDGTDTLYGDAGDDRLYGGGDASSDTLYGGLGNDTLYGGSGTDRLYGGTENDTIYGDDGTDTLYGDAGNDLLYGGNDAVADTLYGDDGNDTLYGGLGSDRLYGGNDNDLIFAGAFGDPDADSLDGGAGQDTVSFIEGNEGVNITLVAGAATFDPPTGANDADTLTGIEHIIGTNFGDTITGDTVANMLDGGANADILYGGAGDDTLYGGSQSDTIYGGAGNDLMYGGSELDVLSYANETGDLIVNLATGEAFGAGNDTVSGFETVLGGSGNDIITGDGLANSLNGNAGNDTLNGGAGADTLTGGTGSDYATYTGSSAGVNVTVNASGNTGGDAAGDVLSGIENLAGSSHNDTLTGDGSSNVLGGLGGADILNALGGDDTVFGGIGSDTIDGGTGNDSLGGDNDADRITGGDGNDTIDGGDGADQIYAGAGNDSAWGGEGADTIEGGAGNDTIDGGTGTDNIDAGAGNDSVLGGTEADTILGGVGNDTIDGGTGDDSIVAGPATAQPSTPVPLDFNWSGVGADGTDITNVTQDTGGINVNVVLTTPGDNFTLFDVETGQNVYVAGGEPFNPGSSGELRRSGDGAATVVDINFSAVAGSNMENEVENVQFRISDIDDSGWRDRIVIRAWDANNNPVTVVLTETSVELVTSPDVGSGATVSALDAADNTSADQPDGSVLVTIAGPVARIEITYDNEETDGQVIYVSDIHFDANFNEGDNDSVLGGDGNDTILGGIGNDTLYGGADNDLLYGGTGNDLLYGDAGNDTLLGDAGTDTMRGGAGNDTFLISDNAEVSATGNDVIFGGGGGEEGGTGVGQPVDTDFDIIDLEAIGEDRVTITYSSTDPLNLVGTIIIYTDASKTVEVGRIDFSEIERIIFCFTPGTMICTDRGDVAVESLQAGDLVMTRDGGLQPLRWTGSRTLSQRELQAKPDLQPVRIAMGAFAGAGPERTMLVSPQHRILIEGARAEILFGEAEVLVPAKHLIGHIEATRALPAEGVTYVHLLFDRHEVVLSDGIWTESFQPAERSLNAMEDAVRDEILALFPELQVDSDGFQSARMSLKAHEVKVLLSN